MSLLLLFFVAVVFLAAVAVFVKRARAGKISVLLSLVAGVPVGVVVALIGCLIFMGGVMLLHSEYDSEEDETLAAIQDSIAEEDDAFDCGEDGPAGTCSGEAPEYTASETVADAVQSGFAPGISDWSDCDRFFVSADGFRNVHFFINNGDRCIRVSTSPVTLPSLYAYAGTSDGWHRFRQYMLKGEAQKMETKDLAGNPMTIKIPVICGANTKYIRVYSDDYVFISEDAGRFSSDGESFSGVEKEVFWTIWKKCFGEDWHLMAGSAGGAPAGNRQTESSGSISDYGVNKCKYCGGSGWCSKCGGRGYVDFMGDIQDCPSCRGFKHCFNCGGSGLQI